MFLVCGESANTEESQCLIYLTKTVLLCWIAKKGSQSKHLSYHECIPRSFPLPHSILKLRLSRAAHLCVITRQDLWQASEYNVLRLHRAVLEEGKGYHVWRVNSVAFSWETLTHLGGQRRASHTFSRRIRTSFMTSQARRNIFGTF